MTPTSARAWGSFWCSALLLFPGCASAGNAAVSEPACYSWTETIGGSPIEHHGGVVFLVSGGRVCSRAWFDRAETAKPWPVVEGVGTVEGDVLEIEYRSASGLPEHDFYFARCRFRFSGDGSFTARFVQRLPSGLSEGEARGRAVADVPLSHLARVRAMAEPPKFGMHEVVLTGDGAVSNPFDTPATVTFTSPSGKPLTVDAFYDGGDTWRARVYVSETGTWTWSSRGQSGTFRARDSNLRGMLRKHRANPQAWMTDDGRWFCNVSDTAYRLFHGKDAPMWREFVSESAALGVTCVRAAALGGWGGTPDATKDDNNTWTWNDPWAGGAAPDFARFDLEKFQTTERRLAWILDRYPDLQIQFILFSFKGYGGEGTGKWWASLPPRVRERTMRYMLARFAAYPNLFWLIVNDMHCSEKFPKNQAFAREIGTFFAAHDPWRHLISTGPNRRAGYPFTSPEDLKWSSYIHIEDANAVGGDPIQQYGFDALPLHVWMAEDYYEQDHGHYADPRFFFRWLFWSWILSGGSANYCGRWGPIHPYSQTGRRDLPWRGADKTDYTGEQLVGLDSAPFIAKYFADRNIDLGLFRPDDGRVADLDGRAGKLRPKLMERGADEFLVYHPNAKADSKASAVDAEKAARMKIDLASARGRYRVEWYRAYDGVAQEGGTIEGGLMVDLVAPWPAQDVVVRLLRIP